MASGLYTLGVSEIMSGNVDLVNDDIYVMLIDTTYYTANLASDSSQADVSESARVASQALEGKTLDGRTFRASDVVFTGIESGKNIDAVAIYLDTDYADTSILLAYIDNADEFPITTDGTNVTLTWDTGANGVFRL